MVQTDPPRSPKEVLPTMYDLKSEDPEEPGLPDEFHDLQPELLRITFHPPGYSPDSIFIASDLNLYYDPHHLNWYKRPDWFVVMGVSRLYEQRDLRLSYVTWQEGVNPFVVVELLSPGTEAEDLGQTLREIHQPPTKWEVYERILRIPYYVVFSRYTNELRVFQNNASRYQELTVSNSRVWMPELELGLGLWQGYYQGIAGCWLRWYDQNQNWIPTPTEQIEQERLRTEQERLRAEKERQKVEELEALLQRYREQYGDLS
ncbi:Uma2 family endonuclease [Planktothrix sp. FACHB-1365]|uniref:Uma2 family endonuclease n=1 Tax=Planktothrix sp. FACHB-1365 TaxID=2692855 RepID=UPI001681C388|nr:Uma2 family endonuclease [Planktothrix sp. FACHB-1365]MBD2485126.1 Uma2 family endonuclease [Planktothrix sp. FACHB-1365]